MHGHLIIDIFLLKLSAENERKAVQAQISNEKLISSNLRNELEKEIEIRHVEKKEIEMEKVSRGGIGAKLFSGPEFIYSWHHGTGEVGTTMETARKIRGIVRATKNCSD